MKAPTQRGTGRALDGAVLPARRAPMLRGITQARLAFRKQRATAGNSAAPTWTGPAANVVVARCVSNLRFRTGACGACEEQDRHGGAWFARGRSPAVHDRVGRAGDDTADVATTPERRDRMPARPPLQAWNIGMGVVTRRATGRCDLLEFWRRPRSVRAATHPGRVSGEHR